MSIAILFSGQAEHGKDSSANLLKTKLESIGKKVLIMHFADLLKFYAKQYFGWDGTKSIEGRRILQWLGTDIVRARNPNFWVQSVIDFMKIFENEYEYFLVADCRFPGEITCFADNGIASLCINVIRLNFENKLTPEQRSHPSERALDGFYFDYVIESASGLDNLSIEIDKLFDKYKEVYW
jgi:hypothetical protein